MPPQSHDQCLLTQYPRHQRDVFEISRRCPAFRAAPWRASEEHSVASAMSDQLFALAAQERPFAAHAAPGASLFVNPPVVDDLRLLRSWCVLGPVEELRDLDRGRVLIRTVSGKQVDGSPRPVMLGARS